MDLLWTCYGLTMDLPRTKVGKNRSENRVFESLSHWKFMLHLLETHTSTTESSPYND